MDVGLKQKALSENSTHTTAQGTPTRGNENGQRKKEKEKRKKLCEPQDVRVTREFSDATHLFQFGFLFLFFFFFFLADR